MEDDPNQKKAVEEDPAEEEEEEKKEHEEQHNVLERATWQRVTANFLSVTFGAIQIPYSYGQMGWLWGSVGLVLSAVSTWVSAQYIGDICLRYGARSYPEIGRLAFGDKGRVLVAFLQWLSYFLTGTVQVAFSGATYQQTLRGTQFETALCTEGWMLVTAITLAVPCVFVASFQEATWLSVVVVTSQMVGLGIFFVQIGEKGKYRAEGLPCYSQFTSASALAALSNIAFSFGGHGVLPELIREMRKPTDFYKAMTFSYGVVLVPLYTGVGLLGFWAFGNAAAANFAENLQDGMYLRVYLWFNAVTTVPLVIVNQVALFVNAELAVGVLPTDIWKNSLVSNADYARLDEAPVGYFQRLPPILVRAAFRGSYVMALYVCARLLIGAGLGPLTDIAGALGIAALTYWMPFVLHAKLFWNDYSVAGLTFTVLNIAFGLFVSVTGFYYALRDLMRGDVRIFQEDACLEGAEFWGNQLWQDHISHDTNAYKTIVRGCCHHGHTCGD